MKDFYARKREWWEWHLLNPQVWILFERFAIEAICCGHLKISHWLLINRIRWETDVITKGSDYKISNDFIAFYARLWRTTHPRHASLFNIKRMKGEHPFEEDQ